VGPTRLMNEPAASTLEVLEKGVGDYVHGSDPLLPKETGASISPSSEPTRR
jgi:hypothetical protein